MKRGEEIVKKIALYGTFPDDGTRLMQEACGDEFELVCAGTGNLDAVQGAEFVVLRGPTVGKAELETLKGVKLYHRWGVGYDTVDVKTAGEMGIPVAIATGANAQAVAELTVALMLAAYRHLPALIHRAGEGRMDREDITDDTHLLRGKKIGLLGVGNIGKRVGRLLSGFEPELYYYDVFRMPAEEEQKYRLQFLPKEELAAGCDIVSLHLPLLESTYHMVDKAMLDTMKPGALLVNTARGGIVDTQALLEALEQGRIWGAALDTVEDEPLPASHPLLKNPRVILLPHAGGSARDINRDMVDCIMDNIRTVAAGGTLAPRFLANREFLKVAPGHG